MDKKYKKAWEGHVFPVEEPEKKSLYQKVCGVYVIYCEKTNSCHLGKSININSRIRQHRLELNRGKGKTAIQKDWNSYSDSFQFIIVEECKKEDLNKVEDKWCVYLHESGFNLYNKVLSHTSPPSKFQSTIDKYLDKGMISEKEIIDAIEKKMSSSFY